MNWMMDTFLNISPNFDKQTLRGVVTGKSTIYGGLSGREETTSRDVVLCILQWAKENYFDLAASILAVQGFGNVRSYTTKILS